MAEEDGDTVATGGSRRPSAPVTSRDLFAGRIEQISDVLSVQAQVGQHGVIYAASLTWRSPPAAHGQKATRAR